MVGGIGSYAFPATSSLIEDVKHWRENAAENFGWVLISESENTTFTARRFGSKEDTNNQPALFIEYEITPGARFVSIQRTNQITFLTIPTAAGGNYQIDFRDSLAAGGWHTLITTNSGVLATDLTVADQTATNSQRYYRLGVF
jgi:hypothetical protein